MSLYISKVVEVHSYKTDWVKLDEQSIVNKYGSVEEFKRKFYHKEIDFDNVVSQVDIKFENYDEYYASIKSYDFNKQIDSLCSPVKTVYDENGNWFELDDF